MLDLTKNWMNWRTKFLFQLTKGLLISAKHTAFTLGLIDSLLGLLESPTNSSVYMSKHFDVLCLDDPSRRGYLTKQSFANVRVLWKQKLFSRCASRLVAGFEEAGGIVYLILNIAMDFVCFFSFPMF